MDYKPIYEFLVWDNCKNHCKFCFQRDNPRIFNRRERRLAIDAVANFIESDKFINGSHVLICGGEIFDSTQNETMFYYFFQKMVRYMKEGVVDLLYINTNLIYENMNPISTLLCPMKDNNLLERIKFTTSYDIEGRFRDKYAFPIFLRTDIEQFKFNLKLIKNQFPTMPIVTNTILTKPACQAIIDGSFSVKDFMEEYQCWVNLIPYIVKDDKLMASRGEIFKALKIVDEENPGYLDKYIPNMCIEQEKKLYVYRDGEYHYSSCKMSPECGHSVNFKRYSDTGSCFCCDLKEIFNYG